MSAPCLAQRMRACQPRHAGDPGHVYPEAAWPLRHHEGDCDVVVVVEVEVGRAPWNAGRWRLTASAGKGAATRTDAPLVAFEPSIGF